MHAGMCRFDGVVLQVDMSDKLVFDVRGLMAEEYVDAGHWRAGSLPFRITKWFERMAFRNADSVIVLTNRIRKSSNPLPKSCQRAERPCA